MRRCGGDAELCRGSDSIQDLLERFGWVPHRNKSLNRDASPEEQSYLVEGGEHFGGDI
jgi:uncharacterized protein (DUF924 family)